jgi:cytoskeletal protein CcmA (bactofilin family)
MMIQTGYQDGETEMAKHDYIFKILCLILMLSFPTLSMSMPESGETVTKRGNVEDDYYAAGASVDIDAVVSGDVVTAGGELYIGHHIKGDVIAAGGSIRLSGNIQDDVRVAGGDITIDANIGDDLIASGGRINVSAATTVGGDAWLAGGDIRVAGTINRDLSAGAGSLRLSGKVHGDVRVQAGELHILQGAVIDGDVLYRGPHEAIIHPDASISGNVTYEQVEWDDSQKGSGIFFFITMTVAAIVLFKLFPGFTLSAVARVSADPLKTIGAGFLVLILVPVAAALMISVIVGVWVGLSLMALYFVALILGFLIACFFVGDWAAVRFNRDVSTTGRRLISVSLVLLVLSLIKLIPVVGGLFIFALLLAGLGALTLQLKDGYSQL